METKPNLLIPLVALVVVSLHLFSSAFVPLPSERPGLALDGIVLGDPIAEIPKRLGKEWTWAGGSSGRCWWSHQEPQRQILVSYVDQKVVSVISCTNWLVQLNGQNVVPFGMATSEFPTSIGDLLRRDADGEVMYASSSADVQLRVLLSGGRADTIVLQSMSYRERSRCP